LQYRRDRTQIAEWSAEVRVSGVVNFEGLENNKKGKERKNEYGKKRQGTSGLGSDADCDQLVGASLRWSASE
jgi:hypothetical protein